MKKKLTIVYLIALVLAIIIPLVKFNWQSDFASDIDNRYLIDIDEVHDFDSLKSFVDDRLGGRRKILELYQNVNLKLFNDLENDELYVGKNNNFFPSLNANEYYGAYHESFVNFVISMNNYCESKDIKFYFMFDPSKTSIYKEDLPDGYNYDNSWAYTLIDNIKKGGVTVVDNLRYFESLNNEGLFNERYDVAHWNDYGALVGTNHLFKTMQKDFPNIKLIDDYETVQVHEEYGINSVVRVNEDVEYINLGLDYIDKSDEMTVEVNEEFNQIQHFVSSNDGIKLLSFQGSYYNASGRSKFLVPNTSEFISIHNYRNVENFDYYINEFKPDAVLFEVTEYTIKEYYFSEWGMNHNTIED